jgi:hypothetical protein
VVSSEFYISIKDGAWYSKNKDTIGEKLSALPSFSKRPDTCQYWLKGNERQSDSWGYDVRIFFQEKNILLEVSGTSPSVHADLSHFMASLRALTEIEVFDDDGEAVDFWG